MGVASDTYASIMRDQYDDWKTRFYPEQQKLMNLATSGELMTNQLARVDATTANSVNNAQVAQNNTMARMGVSSATDGNDNSLGLKASLATATAKNGARSAEQERQINILSGANAGLKSALLSSTTS